MIIIPALLAHTKNDAEPILATLKNHTRWVHVDVLDNTFCPGQTVDLEELEELLPFFSVEVHLMVSEPEKYMESCQRVGAKRIYFHYEAVESPTQTVKNLSAYPFQKGMALNPLTPSSAVGPYHHALNAVLIMTVFPGSQGQTFIVEPLEKIKELRTLAPSLTIGVDGGISEKNILAVKKTGADCACVGSAITRASQPLWAYTQLAQTAQ